ncbi:MAG: hypothetical protein HYS18_02070 [Burkholderiales bacterium]|nr:hypothetical protein [Burkholderiales bacterium]
MRVAVENILKEMLSPHGFSLNVSKEAREYVRERAGLLEIVGTRKSRKVSGQTAVYFSVEGGNLAEPRTYEISHVAPFKNTWWWSKGSSEVEWAGLRQQLSSVVLPYLVSHESEFDEAQAREDVHQGLSFLNASNPSFEKVENAYWRKRGSIIDMQ